MKVVRIIAFVLFSVSLLHAQDNQSILFNPHGDVHSSLRFPSLIGSGYDNFEVTLPSINFHVSNNALTYQQIHSLVKDPQTDESLLATLNSLEESNRIYTSFDLDIAAYHGRIKDSSGEELLSFNVSVTERGLASVHFSKNLFQVLYEGNSQFASVWIKLSPFRYDALYYRDISFGLAKEFELAGEMKIKPALRLKYLQGIGAFTTEKADLSIFTESNGRYIDFDFDYRFNTAFPDKGGDFILGNGHGFGLDLGLKFSPFDQLRLDLAIDNIGFINFNRNNTNYSKDKEYRYEGLEVSFFEEEMFEWGSTDSLEALFDPEETNDPFSVNLQPSIKFLTSYGLTLSSKGETEYYVHNLYLMYVQGFDKAFDKTDIPIIGIGYTFSLNNVFNIGPNFTFGGNHDLAFGFQTSVMAGPFKFLLGSSDLSPVILKKNGKGADIQASFALSF